MGYRPTLIFDTSSINRLADDPDSDALIAALRSGFHTRFTFTSVLEIIATTSGECRRKLAGVCKRLLCSGDCIDPQNEIIRKMVERFEQPSPFDWREVDVRFRDAEKEIARRDNFSDDLAEKEREDARASNRTFVKFYADAKPAFDRLYEAGTDRPPISVSEWVAQSQIEGGPFWTFARKLYEYVAKKPADEPTIRRFVAECSPFHAWMIALHSAQYDRCMRPRNAGPSLRSGRNDIIMSVCLPYCQQFVTNDSGQLECYKEVVSICDLNVNVRSYEEFRNGFFVMGVGAGSAA
jgi:hypothetical protein